MMVVFLLPSNPTSQAAAACWRSSFRPHGLPSRQAYGYL